MFWFCGIYNRDSGYIYLVNGMVFEKMFKDFDEILVLINY